MGWFLSDFTFAIYRLASGWNQFLENYFFLGRGGYLDSWKDSARNQFSGWTGSGFLISSPMSWDFPVSYLILTSGSSFLGFMSTIFVLQVVVLLISYLNCVNCIYCHSFLAFILSSVVSVQIFTTNPDKYFRGPNLGVISPRSTCHVQGTEVCLFIYTFVSLIDIKMNKNCMEDVKLPLWHF